MSPPVPMYKQIKFLTIFLVLEFFVWKDLIEKTEKSNYIVSATRRKDDLLVTYYSCNRSGEYLLFLTFILFGTLVGRLCKRRVETKQF